MGIVYRQNQLFTFLLYCNGTNMERSILDCGAGGKLPPLGIFSNSGYETTGVDFNVKAIEFSKHHEVEHGLDLNIRHGDMRKLEFKDESFGFSYTYNTIFHMTKEDIYKSIQEMKRVTKRGGLIFMNFVSTEDERCGLGEKVGNHEYLELEHGEQVIHSYFHENEAEKLFDQLNLKRIYKETRKRIGPKREGGFITLGYVDYILERQ